MGDVEIIRYGSSATELKAAFAKTSAAKILLVGEALADSCFDQDMMLRTMDDANADVVVGSKRHPESKVEYSSRRRILSRIYYFFVRNFIGLDVTDTESQVILYRRDVLQYALDRMLVKSFAFDLELLTIAASRGAKIVEAPVKFDGMRIAGGVDRSVFIGKALDTLAVFYRQRILGYYSKCLVPEKLDHDPMVSIVIACPERSWMLDECLAAIERQTYKNYEVIVLDDAKTGKVRPAEKRNIGIREAKGEIVAFIDDDAYPDEHWLEYAVKYFGEESIGAVGGPGVTPPGDARMCRIGGEVYDNILLSGNYRYRYHAGGVRMDVDDYPSCNLFVRKSLLEKIGGYRTDFWPGEDTLLCKDIIDNFKRIIYDPWIVVYHHRRALFMPHLRQLGRYAFHRGYFVKRYPSNSLKASYFVPTAFVGGILLMPWIWPVYAFYLLAVVVTCANIRRPHHWLLAAIGVVLSHIVYGVRFAQGLMAKRAPCEFIGVDHGSTEVNDKGEK